MATITSKKGTLRSNHYHPVQEQKVLIISGKYIGVYKDLLHPDSPIKHHLISEGDLVITPPMVVHTMIFSEDTVFINLVNGNRDHNKFGEHTIITYFSKTRKIKKENKRIVGYGSPAKATTLLNFCGFNSNDINYIIDDNQLKQGKTVPGVRIPITNKEMVEKVQPDYMIILAWNFAEEIIRKNEKYQKQGIKFIIPLPKPTIIESQQVQETLKISI